MILHFLRSKSAWSPAVCKNAPLPTSTSQCSGCSRHTMEESEVCWCRYAGKQAVFTGHILGNGNILVVLCRATPTSSDITHNTWVAYPSLRGRHSNSSCHFLCGGLALFSGSVTANVGARSKGERLCSLLLLQCCNLSPSATPFNFLWVYPKRRESRGLGTSGFVSRR